VGHVDLSYGLRKTDDLEGRCVKVLLVGYNGANNTGSEARLLEIIKDVQEIMGQDVHITVPTLNETNLRRYLEEKPGLSIESVSPIFFLDLRRLVKENDLIMMVEGSCYMDTWTSALLWAFLSASKYAHSYGKPSLAYAVDAGELSKGNEKRVKRDASKTSMIITRTNAAAQRLRDWGVTAPIEATADTAFSFLVDETPMDYIPSIWPEAETGAVGLSVVNFYLWPVVLRPCGRRRLCYRWPYYYSYSRKRQESTEALAKGFAKEADRIVERYDKSIALIAMEALDEPLAMDVHRKMKNPKRARVFSSTGYDASEMTFLLRNLDMLITSRYHASVLSLASGVPQIAVGHDLRLWDLFGDLGIREERFIRNDSPNLWQWVSENVDHLLSDPEEDVRALLSGNREHLERARRNKELLREFALKHGMAVNS
jgi:polysaccharide pyruvyl transferase WcaK-like protein